MGDPVVATSDRSLSTPDCDSAFCRVDFTSIKGWEEDDHGKAFGCFLHSARRMVVKPYSTKKLGVNSSHLAICAKNALELSQLESAISGAIAKSFFEDNFAAHQFTDQSGGFVTGYYEPEIAASPVRTDRFRFPLYARPPDLVSIDDATRPADMDPALMFARQSETGLCTYHDRKAINQGILSGKGLELFWLNDPVEAFFIHIQGSARLNLTDGSVQRISYAAKTGHAFTAIGKLLVDRAELDLEEVTMMAIKKWLRAHKDMAMELMEENRSYIFFQKAMNSDMSLGPVAAAGVGLTPMRSLAVDHLLHTFGTPVFVDVENPLQNDKTRFSKLMIAQDTGSAIVGPARGDLFIGSGDAAGEIAGGIKSPARLTILVPKPHE